MPESFVLPVYNKYFILSPETLIAVAAPSLNPSKLDTIQKTLVSKTTPTNPEYSRSLITMKAGSRFITKRVNILGKSLLITTKLDDVEERRKEETKIKDISRRLRRLRGA